MAEVSRAKSAKVSNTKPAVSQKAVSQKPQTSSVAVTLNPLIFAGVLGVILLTPFSRGLFFPKEQMVVLLIALALFTARWIAKFSRNDYAFLRSPLDWATLGIAGAYLLSTFVAVNKRSAVQGDMKYLLYFIIYWLVADLIREGRAGVLDKSRSLMSRIQGAWQLADTRRMLVLLMVVLAGTGMAIIGIGAAAGTIKYNGAFDGTRIFSTVQYPNTLAAYLTAAIMCALALWSRSSGAGDRGDNPTVASWVGRWPAYIWALACYTMFFAFIFTYSRGGWLVFPLAVLIFLILQAPGYRLASLLILGAVAVAFAPFAGDFTAAVAAKNASGVWAAYLKGLPLVLVLNAVVLLIMGLLGRLKPGVRLVVVLVSALLLVGAGSAVLTSRGVPEQVAKRFSSISLNEYEARSRIEWTKDAFKIVKDHPIIGIGGGGWNAVYHMYQSYGYWSTEVHNHFMQVWVATGTLGLVIFLAFWGLLLYSGWRVIRFRTPVGTAGSSEAYLTVRMLLAGALTGALALGVHSLLDFNLSLAGVAIAHWVLAGVVVTAPEALAASDVNPARASSPVSGRYRSLEGDYQVLPRLLFLGVPVLLFAGVASLLAGFNIGQRAALALNSGQYQEAIDLYEKAIQRDPLTASFHADLGQAQAAIGFSSQDASRLSKAKESYERAISLEPYNANLHSLVGSFLIQTGSVDDGLKHIEEALAVHPYEIKRYENLAGAYLFVAKWELSREGGNKENARDLLTKALTLRKSVEERSRSVGEWVVPQFKTPSSTPVLQLHLGQAAAILGQWQQASTDLAAATGGLPDARAKQEASAWLEAVKVNGKGASSPGLKGKDWEINLVGALASN